ncbi:MAG: T9SS type A sorting domain-containing protein [Bacteroidetes bacterium]|nr:T9SS type A sorting domain-containing protein [Bacteroidota bacterium]
MKTIFLFFLFPVALLSQQTVFQKNFNQLSYDCFRAIASTSDGGYLIAGETNSNGNGGLDVWVIKTDANGDTLWTRMIGGPQTDRAHAVAEINGEYLVQGTTNSFGSGRLDLFLVKLNSAGDTIFTRTYGSALDESVIIPTSHIIPSWNGGYVFTGLAYSDTTLMNNNAYVVCTDSSGNVVWANIYTGIGNSFSNSIQRTTDSSYVFAAGGSLSTAAADYILTKIDRNGNVIWCRDYDTQGGVDWAMNVQTTADSGYIMFGMTDESNLYASIGIIRTDSNGVIEWAKEYKYPTHGTWINDAVKFSDASYIVAGYIQETNSNDLNAFLMEVDFNGDTVWTRKFGSVTGHDEMSSVQVAVDNGIIAAGYSIGFGNGSFDGYLVKTNSMGEEFCNDLPDTMIISNVSFSDTLCYPGVVSLGVSHSSSPGILSGCGNYTSLCFSPASVNEEQQQISFSLFPDPAIGEINIEIKNTNENYLANITDVSGRIILSPVEFSKNIQINISSLSPGIYFVQIMSENKHVVAIKKLIVE